MKTLLRYTTAIGFLITLTAPAFATPTATAGAGATSTSSSSAGAVAGASSGATSLSSGVGMGGAGGSARSSAAGGAGGMGVGGPSAAVNGGSSGQSTSVGGDKTGDVFGFGYAAPGLSISNDGVVAPSGTEYITLPTGFQFPAIGGGGNWTEVFMTMTGMKTGAQILAAAYDPAYAGYLYHPTVLQDEPGLSKALKTLLCHSDNDQIKDSAASYGGCDE